MSDIIPDVSLRRVLRGIKSFETDFAILYDSVVTSPSLLYILKFG